MTARDILRRQRRHLWPAVFHYYRRPLPLVRGRMQRVWDADGRRYLDFFGGISTISVGHCHPEVVRRVNAQTRRLVHASTLYPSEPQARLAELIARIAPKGLSSVFFTNSGSEANEAAVLLARNVTGATDVIALRHSYSGRTGLAMSLNGHAGWRVAGVTDPGVRHAVAPYCYRCPLKRTYPACDVACASDLEELIRTTTRGRVAAFLAEPILGVGGYITPPPEYFRIAAGIVRRHGGLFIADEVQTGWGRTGEKLFGVQQYGVTPDIMTFAKGIANGFPLGATLTRPAIARAFKDLTISTFGGNPVSSEAARATIEIVLRKRLARNAATVGGRLRQGLLALQERHPGIGDVRGMGLMQAMEFVGPGKRPDPGAVRRLMEEARKRGLLVGRGGLYGNVIRLAPPLTISAADVDEALRILDRSLTAARRSR